MLELAEFSTRTISTSFAEVVSVRDPICERKED
jgi:hypothetical protein